MPSQASGALEAGRSAVTATAGGKGHPCARGPSPCPPVLAELSGRGDPSVRAMPKRMHEGKRQDLLLGRSVTGVPPPLLHFPHALLGAPVASLSCRSTCRQWRREPQGWKSWMRYRGEVDGSWQCQGWGLSARAMRSSTFSQQTGMTSVPGSVTSLCLVCQHQVSLSPGAGGR